VCVCVEQLVLPHEMLIQVTNLLHTLLKNMTRNEARCSLMYVTKAFTADPSLYLSK
jgi:hypothetical protein